MANNFKIYQSFDEGDIISGKNNTVSNGFFPGNQATFLQSLLRTDADQKQLTGSNGVYDVLNGLYYTNVYDSSAATKQLLFSISYGDKNGGGVKTGSLFKNTKAIYSQFANTLLGISDEDGLFSFKTGSSTSNTYITSSEVFVMAFSSNLMNDQIDKGQWAFALNGASGSASLHLVDETPLLTPAEKKEQRLVYQIISGSFDGDIGRTVSSGEYHGIGLFYPKNGVMVFNANKLAKMSGLNFDNGTGSLVHVDNSVRFYNQMVAVSNRNMRVRKSEIVPSTHYFVRVKNQDFNFSNNPSFVYAENISGSLKGEVINALVEDPKTYVTTVGLYNEQNELIAVAKLSQPTKKDFSSELSFRIRLDF